jgi:4-methylaminobutanoate oxidase (formaldehyde-forming)
MGDTLPGHARAVVIGGGVVGASVAYHLAALGWREVVLVERQRLTSGTTWHAAGLIGQLRATASLTRLARCSAELYDRLEAMTGQATGYRRCGSISLAHSDARMEELLRAAGLGRTLGLEIERLSPAEIARRHPLVATDGLVGGIWIPADGQADPVGITLALAKAARQAGAVIREGVRVTGILRMRGRAAGVETDHGTIRAEHVVNCAGMWGREVGRMAGVAVPLQACEHFYAVTEPIPGLPADLPVLREPDAGVYYKADAGKLLVGGFEPVAKPWAVDGIPEDAAFLELPEDWDHFLPLLEAATARLPVLRDTGIRKLMNGPESFTPDDRYLLGEAPELPGFWVACGFNSIGIQSAGGAGMALAQWMEAGRPTLDLADVDIRRMHPCQATRAYLRDRVSETLGLLYAMHWPHRQPVTARGARRSPLHEPLAALGAQFGEVAGYERPLWFRLPDDPEPVPHWRRPSWFGNVAREHMTVREKVGLLDLSSLGKLLVEGPDALALLQRVATADLDVPVGRVVYTLWLNEAGGVESEVTIRREGPTRFLVIGAAIALRKDQDLLVRRIGPGERVTVQDASASLAVIGLMGPRARALLARLTADPVDAASLPFGWARPLEIGYAPVVAQRLSYVGELGFELFVAADQAAHVLERVLAEGAAVGLGPCGFLAIDTLRLEKGFRHAGHDMGSEDSALEAGLGFLCAFAKPGGFVGRDALLRQREQGRLRRRLVHLALAEDAPPLYRDEPIRRDGAIVGRVTSGGQGHWLGHPVGLGYVACERGVDATWLDTGRFEVEIADRRWPATAALRGPYDPLHARMRS